MAAAPTSQAAAPSEADALAYLDEVVGIVRAGDLDRLCEHGVGTCERILDATARASSPRAAPRVVASVDVPAATHPDGSWTSGGRLLTLCGIDGNGQAYVSEMLVFRESGRLIAIQPVFWTGLSVGLTQPGVTRAEPPGPCPE